MYRFQKRDGTLKHTTENRDVLKARSFHELSEQIKYKEAHGYELLGEIKEHLDGYWGCLMVKQINLKGRV